MNNYEQMAIFTQPDIIELLIYGRIELKRCQNELNFICLCLMFGIKFDFGIVQVI